ncbi:MAG: hypothetical protein EOO70_05825 [Myxococcaceae bacterium]|nr:MAG: hypothetical protein EOO70_05825 [Myxococcaceae bacterium]
MSQFKAPTTQLVDDVEELVKALSLAFMAQQFGFTNSGPIFRIDHPMLNKRGALKRTSLYVAYDGESWLGQWKDRDGDISTVTVLGMVYRPDATPHFTGPKGEPIELWFTSWVVEAFKHALWSKPEEPIRFPVDWATPTPELPGPSAALPSRSPDKEP